MVTRSNPGFSFSTNSQAAFSAKSYRECQYAVPQRQAAKDGSHLATAICLRMILLRLFPSKGIPDCLIVHPCVVKRVNDRSKRRGHNDTLHGRGICLDRLEDPGCTLDRRAQEILHGVLDIVVEWRSSVKDIFQARVGFDRL